MILTNNVDVDQRIAVLDVLTADGARDPGGVADHVKAAQLAAQPLEDGVVAHPVGDERRQPGGPLRAIVVGPRHADLPGDRVAVVADARVLDAATRLGVAEIVAGVAPGALQHDAVGVAAAAADEKAHGVHQ